MNGGLAIHVALALHGNQWIADGAGPAPSLEATGSTFRYVRSFDADGATTTAQWFEQLHDAGVDRLRLACSPPRNADDVGLTAFAQSHPWALAEDSSRWRFWSGVMNVGEGADRERPWDVVLQPYADGPPTAAPGVATASTGLREALAKADGVARGQGWLQWSEWFDRATAQLDSADPQPQVHPDLAVPGTLDLDRQRLLAAAVDSWVFGGMGSWNDEVPGDPEERAAFDAATVDLFTAAVTAFMAVVNG